MGKIHDTPSNVDAEDGEVIVEGPAGIAHSFTPDAAVVTSDRLLQGGMKARGQQIAAQREMERRTQMRSIPPEE